MTGIEAMLLLLSVADAKPACKSNPALAGPCFTFRGRLRTYNGNPTFRIWRIGTKRILGVTGAKPGEEPILPADVACGFDCDVFARFEVCPFRNPEAGVMQRVCVEAVTGRVTVKAK
jgi:hypothetical protein